MRNFGNRLLNSASAAALLLAVNTLPAQAADQIEEIQSAEHDWSGPYIGVHIGFAGGINDGNHELTSSSYSDLGATSDFFALGGGQIGWNFQDGNAVFGVEGDISALGWDGESIQGEEANGANPGSSVIFEADYLATVRGRMGIADDDVLLYATGGVAFVQGNLLDQNGNNSISINATGLVVGAGIEWAATRNVSVRMEGLYARFGESQSIASFFGNEPGDVFELEDMLMFRLGANWKLNGATDLIKHVPDEPVMDWTGLYFGGLVGAGTLLPEGWYDSVGSSSAINMGGLSDTGLLGGGLIGWNFYQNEHTVLGIEGDISFVDWNNTARAGTASQGVINFDADYFATIRGRVGYADGDLLIYATAGVAFLSGELNFISVPGVAPGGRDVNATGIVAGAGMEWAATDNFSVKAEGLWTSFNDTYSFAGISDADTGDGFDASNTVVTRISLNWRVR